MIIKKSTNWILACLSGYLIIMIGHYPTAAHAASEEYGLAAGPSIGLFPTDSPGVTLGVSALVSGSDEEDLPASVLRARGELVGTISNNLKSVLPTITGDLGLLRQGPFDLSFIAGVQLFGFAAREQYTVFATFGLIGGAGMSLQVHQRVRLCLRGIITWLPPPTTAILAQPSGQDDKPNFIFTAILFGVEFGTGTTSKASSDFDDF